MKTLEKVSEGPMPSDDSKRILNLRRDQGMPNDGVVERGGGGGGGGGRGGR